VAALAVSRPARLRLWEPVDLSEEGNNARHVSPDCFVVLDCEPGFRRVYKVWDEGKAPDVVLEVTSNSTRRQDEDSKPAQYGAMGVKEYFLYDPTADYLEPPLQGYRFVKGQAALLRRDKSGALVSRCLGVKLRLEGLDLVMTDQKTGERLLTKADYLQAQHETAEAQRRAAEEKRKQAEGQLRAAKAEIAKLRRQLRRGFKT
jgi:hypothetical protein